MEERTFTSKELIELILKEEHECINDLSEIAFEVGDDAVKELCFYSGVNSFANRILSVIEN